jgi:hypothetical protein
MTLPYDPDLADRMVDMDPRLLHLLTQEITSFGLWDALRYFLETGSERATMDEIGLAVGRDSDIMLSILGELTTRGWLARRVNEEGITEYVLTQEQERRTLLDHFHATLQERTFRLQAIYHWTQSTA